MPTVALVVISDRGDRYLPQCLDRLNELAFPFAQQIIIEDPTHEYGQNEVVREAWGRVKDDCDFVAHVEEDFVLHEFPVLDMVRILEENPELAQVVLKRQPWNGSEIRAGGIIEQDPPQYEDCAGFVKHNRIFSLNPCIIPTWVTRAGWNGESDASDRLRDAGYFFAFYGQKADPPRCTHIGDVRWSP